MEALEKWMEQNKKLCVITGIFGLLVSPFLWPFFVAILFQSLSMMVPVLLAWILIKQPWAETEKKEADDIPKGGAQKDWEPVDSGKKERESADNRKHGQESTDGEKKGQKSESNGEKKGATPDDADCLAILWYQNEGRERILRIRNRLEKEGRRGFSVSRDGICTIRQETGFQRVGVLRGYPGKHILSAESELRKDGYLIRQSGDYVWISWKKGGAGHAL